MQDKIQEIMGLVTQHAYIYYSAAIGGCRDADDVKESECAIESKLRELVREPLSEDECEKIRVSAICENGYGAMWYDTKKIIRMTERAHNITNTSN